MKTIPYVNTAPLANPAAADYIPTFVYEGLSDPSGRPDVEIRNDFYGTRRRLRIGVLGAGISGLQFLHFAQRLEDVEIVVYEMNEEVGGVVRVWAICSWVLLTLLGTKLTVGISGSQVNTLVADVTLHLRCINSHGEQISGLKCMRLLPKIWHICRPLPGRTISIDI